MGSFPAEKWMCFQDNAVIIINNAMQKIICEQIVEYEANIKGKHLGLKIKRIRWNEIMQIVLLQSLA